MNETSLVFTETEVLEELNKHPENFSPNVLLRPVYQECILPNLAYIGGGGELAYWFQLKSSFEHFQIPMPMLLLRNSVMWLDQKQHKYFKNLGLSLKELFQREGELAKAWTIKNANEDVLLLKEKENLELLFNSLISKLENKDSSIAEHTKAVKAKQLKALKGISEKWIRSTRKQEESAMRQIAHLKETLFPKGGLQERKDNFSNVYVTQGKSMFEILEAELVIPTQDFTVFKI